MAIESVGQPAIKIALALGSGSARGWSHIGVIQALEEHGIEPDIICGCSIGAVVGASYLTGRIADLETGVRSLNRLETARFLELSSRRKGFINKARLHGFFNEHLASDDVLIEDQSRAFASVATDLVTGREIWFSKGLLLEAVWASISVPGLFPPIQHHQHWLVDGGLVNPVPVSVCRAMGADVVIAVNLNGALIGKHSGKAGFWRDTTDNVRARLGRENSVDNGAENSSPGLFEAVASSINIVQDRITRSRMAGDPPDIIITPDLADLGLLEFFRAEEAIAEGRASVERQLPELRRVLAMEPLG